MKPTAGHQFWCTGGRGEVVRKGRGPQ